MEGVSHEKHDASQWHDGEDRGGYRGGPSWSRGNGGGGGVVSAPDSALATIAECNDNSNDDDVEAGLSCISESDRSLGLLQASYQEQKLVQEPMQQQQEQRDQQHWNLQRAIQDRREQQHHWQLQRVVQEELDRADDRMSDLSFHSRLDKGDLGSFQRKDPLHDKA